MNDIVKKLPPLPEEFTEAEKENKTKGMPKVTKQDLIGSRKRLSDDLNEIRRKIASLRRNV